MLSPKARSHSIAGDAGAAGQFGLPGSGAHRLKFQEFTLQVDGDICR